MRNILLMAKNTLKVKFRKKGSILVYIIIPVILVVISSLFNNGSSENLNIGIVDKNKSVLSQDFIKYISKSEKFNVKSIKEKDIKDYVATSKVDCTIVVPKNYDSLIYKGKLKNIDIISVRGMEKTGWIKNYINSYLGDLKGIALGAKGEKETFNKIYNEYKKSKLTITAVKLQDEVKGKATALMSIGILIMFIMFQACNTAGTILEDKKNRVYYRISSSPVSNKQYLAANILSGFTIILIQIILVTIMLYAVLNVNTGISFINFFFILVLVGLVSISIGLVVVSFSNSTDSNIALINLIITPSCMLSGCLWPLDVMPKIMQKIAYIFPQAWIVKLTQKLQEGKGFENIIVELLIIIGFMIVLFLLAAFNFKRKKNVNNFI